MKPNELRDAIDYTSELTGFQSALVEKDYYCSLVLKKIYDSSEFKDELIFKGGTLLSKAFFDFFRMSEDLDFSVANEHCHERSLRRQVAEKMRKLIPGILGDLNLKESTPFRGFNESKQYNATFSYDSVVAQKGQIKFEIGFRGDLLLPPERLPLKTLLREPLQGELILFPFHGLALQKVEAMAEKVRAALTRKTPAIRDFFDVYTANNSGFDFMASHFVVLVQKKLMADRENPPNLTMEKKKLLTAQIKHELAPVLKLNQEFNLEISWGVLEKLSHAVAKAEGISNPGK